MIVNPMINVILFCVLLFLIVLIIIVQRADFNDSCIMRLFSRPQKSVPSNLNLRSHGDVSFTEKRVAPATPSQYTRANYSRQPAYYYHQEKNVYNGQPTEFMNEAFRRA